MCNRASHIWDSTGILKPGCYDKDMYEWIWHQESCNLAIVRRPNEPTDIGEDLGPAQGENITEKLTPRGPQPLADSRNLHPLERGPPTAAEDVSASTWRDNARARRRSGLPRRSTHQLEMNRMIIFQGPGAACEPAAACVSSAGTSSVRAWGSWRASWRTSTSSRSGTSPSRRSARCPVPTGAARPAGSMWRAHGHPQRQGCV